MASNPGEPDSGNSDAVTNSQINPQPNTAPSPVPSSQTKFKFKYPEAYPAPDGEDNEMWNKLYTAADSRMYNKHGKNANESRKLRQSGATRELALQMLQERKEKAAKGPVPQSLKTSTPKAPAKNPTAIKEEASSSSRDATPFNEKMNAMSISEKIKSGGRTRKASPAAPPDVDAPGPSIASAIMSSPAPPAPPALKVEKPKKKGTAAPIKKRATKRKPRETAENLSTSNVATAKNLPSSDDESNDGGEYCICRGPDDHRMMVYCDGGCDDWYHCSCLKIDEADAKELLDRFICPKCETKTLFTTWKRYCRYGNVGKFLMGAQPCRKAARVSDNPPSKYCSDEHRDAFWVFVRDHLCRHDDEPSRGGRLNVGEVGWILSQCKTVEEIHALGQKPKLPVKDGADSNNPAGLNYLSEEDAQLLQKNMDRQLKIVAELAGYKNKEKLRMMVLARAEKAAAHLEVKVKDICGYDSRLAMNQLEFAQWSKTEEGKRVLSTGVLGPRTSDTKTIGARVRLPGQVAAEVSEDPELCDICLKKKCIKHRDWSATCKADSAYAYNLLVQEKKKLCEKREEIISEAETTEAMRPEYADNITIQLF